MEENRYSAEDSGYTYARDNDNYRSQPRDTDRSVYSDRQGTDNYYRQENADIRNQTYGSDVSNPNGTSESQACSAISNDAVKVSYSGRQPEPQGPPAPNQNTQYGYYTSGQLNNGENFQQGVYYEQNRWGDSSQQYAGYNTNNDRADNTRAENKNINAVSQRYGADNRNYSFEGQYDGQANTRQENNTAQSYGEYSQNQQYAPIQNAGVYYEEKPKKPKKKKDVRNTVLTVCLILIIIFNAISIVINLTNNRGTVELATSNTTYEFTESLTDVSDVVAAVMPAVVSITSRTLVSSGGFWWGFYIGEEQTTTEEVESGIGSGTIIGTNDSELLILTSYHVVEDCSSLYVTFADDESVDGTVKNADEDTDIAIVAVPIDDIKASTLESIAVATLSTSEVETGEGVIVIGNALGYGQSVVTGIISATSREITLDDNTTITVLQTDAAINSGNSGGCVLNALGEVIGISEAKIQDTAVEGMCYAIPIAENYDLIVSLMSSTTQEDDT